MNLHVEWSDEDQEWVGLCDEYPSLSWLHKDRQKALDGISELAYATRDELAAMGARGGEQKCAELKCPCGCGNVVRTWHAPNCPDDCAI